MPSCFTKTHERCLRNGVSRVAGQGVTRNGTPDLRPPAPRPWSVPSPAATQVPARPSGYRRPTLIAGYEIEIDGLAALEEGAAA